MLKPADHAAADKARRSGLTVSERIRKEGEPGAGQRFLEATSPVLTSHYEHMRLVAARAIDPAFRAASGDAFSLNLECMPLDHSSWYPHGTTGKLASDLVADWYRPVLDFLFHDSPAAHAAEMARQDDWAYRSYQNAHDGFRIRQDTRVHGTPLLGDLLVSSSGMESEFDPSATFHIFRHIDPAPVGGRTSLEAIPFDDAEKEKLGAFISPVVFPFLRKLGSASLDLLPQGILNAHQRLKLIGHQQKIDAARAHGPITLPLIRKLWSGAESLP